MEIFHQKHVLKFYDKRDYKPKTYGVKPIVHRDTPAPATLTATTKSIHYCTNAATEIIDLVMQKNIDKTVLELGSDLFADHKLSVIIDREYDTENKKDDAI